VITSNFRYNWSRRDLLHFCISSDNRRCNDSSVLELIFIISVDLYRKFIFWNRCMGQYTIQCLLHGEFIRFFYSYGIDDSIIRSSDTVYEMSLCSERWDGHEEIFSLFFSQFFWVIEEWKHISQFFCHPQKNTSSCHYWSGPRSSSCFVDADYFWFHMKQWKIKYKKPEIFVIDYQNFT
jgi:hypothetical protein